MKPYDIASVRERFRTLSTLANEQLGMFNSENIGIGRYVAGKSPWERHNNGDELLLVPLTRTHTLRPVLKRSHMHTHTHTHTNPKVITVANVSE